MKSSLQFLLYFILLGSVQSVFGQQTYSWIYTPNTGNPGGLNVESDGSNTGWTNIAGIPGLLSTNTWTSAVAIPFTFNYYGTSVTHFKASANGLLTFDTLTVGSPANQNNLNLPTATIPNRTIGIFWDNFTMLPPTGANDFVQYKTFGTAPNRQFWIRWSSFEWASGSSFLFGSIVLEETTNKIYIVDQYTTAPVGTDLMTIGLQKDATTAVSAGSNLNFAGNTSVYTDNDFYTFTPLSVGTDAGLLNIASPVPPACTGTQNFAVTLYNASTTPLTSATINWSVNGVSQPAYNWTGNLASNISASVTLGTVNIVNGISYNFSATVTSPNGGTDSNASNNTTSRTMNTPLAGSYTINSGQATGGGNFNSFTSFATYAQVNGICSSVIVDVVTNQTEQVLIGEIPGASATQTITINGNGRTLSYGPSATNRYILGLNGTKYLTVNGLTIATSTASYCWGVWITNQVSNVTINACTIDLSQMVGNIAGAGAGIVFSSTSSGLSAGNNGSNISITNNSIRYGFAGIYINGQASPLTSNVTISNNQIWDFYEDGIFASYTSGLIVSNNDFHRLTQTNTTDFYGVYLSTGCIGSKVNSNIFHDTHTGASVLTSAAYGVYVSASANANAYNDVYNNIFYKFNNNGAQTAIMNSGGSYCRINHNSIDFRSTLTSSSPTIGIQVSGVSAVGIDVVNNIVSLDKQAAGQHYCIYITNTASIINCNYNDWHTIGGMKVGYWGTTSYSTLSAWQAANGNAYDQNSVSIDPMFLGGGNYTPTSVPLNNLGTSNFVTTDYYGVTRIPTTPDMGAIEFSPLGLDAQISWVSPLAPVTAGVHPIVVKITNGQVNVINSVKLRYVAGATTVSQTFTGLNITIGQSNDLQFTTPYNLTANVTMVVTIDSVNGIVDGNTLNNTVTRNLCIGMIGTYTINNNGTGNFLSYNAAVNAMKSCGLLGPVTINTVAASGPYTEQVVIPNNIPGMGATAPVTFNGNATTLQFSPTDTARHIVWVKGTDYLTLSNINIVSTSVDYGYGILINNQSEHCTISGCTINLGAVTEWSGYKSCAICATPTTHDYYAPGSNVSNLTVQNCTISGSVNNGGANVGIVVTGSASAPSDSLIIINNTIQDFKFYGLATRNVAHGLFSGNDFSRPNILGNYSAQGIVTSGSSYNNKYLKNKLHNFYNGAPSAQEPSIYGIYNYADGIAGQPNIFANNLIYNMTTNRSLKGIYTINADYSYYFHNTISIDNPNFAGQNFNDDVMGFFVTNQAVDVRIQNNIVRINVGGEYAKAYGIYLQTLPTGLISDYNDVYVTNSSGFLNANWGYYQIDRPTMADYRTSVGTDLNSKDDDALLTNPLTGNLTPRNTQVNNTGTNLLTLVPTDFYNVARTATPDMGAIEFTPSSCPPPSNTITNSLAFNAATLSWRENGTATSWNMTWGTSPTINGAGNTVVNNINALTYQLTGLSSSTTYYVWIQSNCGGGGTTTWTGPYAFITYCSPTPLPWTEDFDAMTNAGYLELPSCWTLESGEWTTGNWNGNNTPPSLPNSLSNFNRPRNWVWTPAFSFVGSIPYAFSFDYQAMANNSSTIQVYYNTSPTSVGATFVSFINTPTGSGMMTSWLNYANNLTFPTTGVYYIGINIVSNGTYTYTGFDNFNIINGTCSPFTPPVAATNPLCSTGTGSATVTQPYTFYSWSNGEVTQSIPYLNPGVYSVTVTNAQGCVGSNSVTVTAPSAITATITSQTNLPCFFTPTGSATVAATGGGSSFSFLWSNGQTTATATGLYAGTSTVTITNANGCQVTKSVVLTQPNAFNAGADAFDVSCFGAANGVINAITAGGTAPLSYHWSNGATTIGISGLTPNTYSLTVTDQHGCSSTASASITQPSTALTANYTHNNPACFGNATGTAQANPSGGTAGYTYHWSNGQTGQVATGLAAGNITVTVSDANGCSVSGNTTITQPASALSANATVSSPLGCNGDTDGIASSGASGGTAPYAYHWSNNQTTASATGLIAGTYTVSITDANGCSLSSSVTVTAPSAIVLTLTPTNPTTSSSSNGSVISNTSGGASGYTYTWSNGAITQNLQNVSVGTYCVTVEDVNGCTSSSCVTLTAASGITVTGTSTPATNTGSNDGAVDITVSGGTGPYTYVWSNGATTEDITGIPPGTYTVTVTDANGNTATYTTTILVGIDNNFNAQVNLTAFPNPAKEEINIHLELPSSNEVTFELYSMDGKLVLVHQSNASNEHLWRIPLNNCSQGSYFVKCIYGQGTRVVKFEVLK